MSQTDTNPTVARAIEAVNDHDVEGTLELFADDGTFRDPPQDEPLSKPQFHEYLVEMIERYPDFAMEEERVLSAPDGTTAVEWTFSGTHPTGAAFELPGASIIAVSDGEITYWRDYWDQQTWAEQVGAD